MHVDCADMDEEDYPRFDNAFPATETTSPTKAPSWNPALRPDSDAAESDEDFFDRYPDATPKKPQNTSNYEQLLDAPEPEDDPIRRGSISVESVVDVRSENASPEELEETPLNTASAEGPMTYAPQEAEIDDEDPILYPSASAAEQDEQLESIVPDTRDLEATQELDSGVSQVDHAAMEPSEEERRPGEGYDYQGEVTAMEQATEPSSNAPLLDDEEPLPTPGNMSREPTFRMSEESSAMGLDGAPAPGQPQAQAQPARVQLDRTFTSNFSDSPIEPSQVQSQSAPEDWPSYGDDKTFGELLDGEQPQQTGEEIPQQQSAAVFGDDDVEDLLPADGGLEEDLAAAWGAALDDDDILEETPTTGFDPSSAFGGLDDEDGFLEDEIAVPAQPQQQQTGASSQQRNAPGNLYRPANPRSATQPAHYAPAVDSGLARSGGTPATGLPDFYNQPAPPTQQSTAQRPPLQQAQSFVDKAKRGYQSPYDLPMEVVKPRRRPQMQQQTSQQAPAPPPRTSSFNAQMGQPLPPTASSMSPPSTGSSAAPPPALGSASAKNTPRSGSGFFEDLPIAAKPRARPSGAYTPGPAPQGMPTPPPGSMRPPQHPPSRALGGPVQPPQRPAAPPTPSQQPIYGGLQQPQTMPLLPDQPMQQPVPQPPVQQGPPPSSRYSPSAQAHDLAVPAPPAATGRYSLAPAASQAPAPSRYSPAPVGEPGHKPRQSSSTGPPPGPMFRQPSHAFAPRTSSPLAGSVDKPHPPLPSEASKRMLSSPPQLNGLQTSNITSPENAASSRYSPLEMRAPETHFPAPPPRPRTQSPDNAMKAPKTTTSHARRPSSAGRMAQVPAPQPVAKRGPALPHRRQFSRDLTILRPQNETAHDPLERWKGHAIFSWNASGTVLSSFPRQTPIYSGGSGVPSIKSMAGSIKMEDASTFMSMDDRNAKFPGPLQAKSKSKKKDVLAWMTGKVEDLERATEGAMLDFNMEPDAKKRVEEKLVLWKIMRVFVEYDGVLEGNAKIEEEVRKILLPNLAQMGQVMELQTPTSATMTADAVDKYVLLQLRLALFEGQRERAVWLAEEKKLWGHAMLIASTMGPETWKQIVQAFVRSQVKSIGADARSMAALYQVFAGNSEECVDELVPPSARAGYQMISREDGGSVSRNPLDGLDSWRETLGLVTSNRTPSDGPSLVSLGKLLSSYGRVEAAHACFLFARQFVKHSGADDVEAHFVLLGGNHQSKEESIGSDLDSILLTEIYEYATSLSAPSSGAAYLPYLQSFKLVHAQDLAAHGLKSKAQAYCDHITTAYTSTTRPSPYYHPTFTQAVADLGAFLGQTPQDGKKGLFSKPAMKTVSSSASNWFSKFVAGDDEHGAAAAGTPGAPSEDQAGPFGMVGASPPSSSRPSSRAEMYNPMMGGGMPIHGMTQPPVQQQQPFAPSSAPSRFGSGGGSKYAPASTYSSAAMPAAEPQRPSSSRYAPAPAGMSSLGVPGVQRPEGSRASSEYGGSYAPSSRRNSAQDVSSQGSYEPRPILADDASGYSYSPPVLARPDMPPPHVPDTLMGLNGSPDPIVPPTSGSEEIAMDPETGGYAPPSQGSGYEPPSYSYQPYEPEPDSPVETKLKPKPKRFGDDDDDADDIASRAASLKKAQADRAADEAFRKAAEADAARSNDKAGPGDKKGWGWGGWFGGKKDPNAPPGPIRAKLGEESSFYYDNDLGKWVNKKGGADAALPAAPTPPPPKGMGSRVASRGPPSGPPSRASSGSALPPMGTSRPPTSGSGPAFSGPPSGPPSRVGTPASTISEAAAGPQGLAPPLPLNGVEGGPASGPPSRPPTSLSTASSIDDLLAGPPGARKGGTVKGKKKAGRYVDVMAK